MEGRTSGESTSESVFVSVVRQFSLFKGDNEGEREGEGEEGGEGGGGEGVREEGGLQEG